MINGTRTTIFLGALSCILIYGSCASLNNSGGGLREIPTIRAGWQSEDELPFEYFTYQFSDDVFLFPDQNNEGPRLTFFLDLIQIQGDGDKKQNFLRQVLYDGLPYQQYASEIFDKQKVDYLSSAELAQLSGDYSGESRNWSYMEIFNGWVYPQHFDIVRTRESYTGGAHPTHERIYYVLDTKNYVQIHLDDILQAGARAELQKQIEAELRVKYLAAPNAPLTSIGFFEDSVAVPENFYITKEGIGFCWNPYEIAPYVRGTLEIVLPKAQITPLLNDRGKDIFNNL
jgi:hypothetical protein